MEWDGEERRNGTRDHDVLTRIDANLSNFMKRFDDHVKDDERQFLEVKLELKSSQEESRANRWYIAVGIGIIACLEFFKDKIFK